MIVQTFPTRKKQVTHNYMPPAVVAGSKPTQMSYPKEERPNQADQNRAKQFNITPEEFVRRDKIVRQMWIDCQYRTGEVVRPMMPESFEEYGRITIRGVFKSYHDFPQEEAKEWPKDDRPFIITCEPEKGEQRLLVVTPAWLSRFQ